MAEIATFQKALWGLATFSKVALLALLLYRKNHKTFPALSAYVLMTLMQDAILFLSYRAWGFASPASIQIGWGTQSLVILLRGLAVAEICRRMLAKYTGIWALAWRLLFASVALLLVYSMVVAGLQWQLVVLNADRGLELTIATAIVILFLFAHYYAVPVESAVRYLATGFFLYSSFFVLNDTILEDWKYRYATVWNLLGMFSFLTSLIIWTWALREKLPETAPEPEMLSPGAYRRLVPEIDLRLKVLNDRLTQFWYAGARRP